MQAVPDRPETKNSLSERTELLGRLESAEYSSL